MKKKTFIRNVLVDWIGRSFSIISAIVLTPLLLGYFGKLEYGLWETIGYSISFFALLDIGIANSVSRFFARNMAIGEEKKNNHTYSTALVFFCAATLVALIVTFVFAVFLDDIFDIPEQLHETSFAMVLILGVQVSIIFPLRVGSGILQSIDRFDIISIIQLINKIIYLIAIVLIFGNKTGNLIVLASITAVTFFVTELAIFLVAKRRFPYLRFKKKYVTKVSFMELFSLGSSSLVMSVSGILYSRGKIILLGAILGLSTVPLFSVPANVFQKAGPFINRLGSMLMPTASRLDAKGDIERLKTINCKTVKYGLSISIPIGVYLFFYGEWLIKLWLGSTQLTQSDFSAIVMCLSIMVVPFSLGQPQIASRSILKAVNKHWLVANITIISVVVGLVVAIILMTSPMGVIGAAIGWGVKILLADVLLIPFYMSKHIGIRIITYFINTFSKPVLFGLFLSLYCFIVKLYIPNLNLFNWIIQTLIFGVLVSITLILSIEKIDRQYLYNLFVKKRND